MRPRTPGGGGALPAERLQGRGRPGPGLGARGRPGPGGSGTRTPARRDRARPRGGRRATLRTSVLGCPQVRAPRVSPPRRGHGGLSARSRVPNAGADRDAAEPAQPAQDSRGFGSAAQRASCARLESVRTRPERGASGWRTAAAELPPPASRGRARQAPELLISWLSRKLFTSAPTGAAGAA